MVGLLGWRPENKKCPEDLNFWNVATSLWRLFDCRPNDLAGTAKRRRGGGGGGGGVVL